MFTIRKQALALLLLFFLLCLPGFVSSSWSVLTDGLRSKLQAVNQGAGWNPHWATLNGMLVKFTDRGRLRLVHNSGEENTHIVHTQWPISPHSPPPTQGKFKTWHSELHSCYTHYGPSFGINKGRQTRILHPYHSSLQRHLHALIQRNKQEICRNTIWQGLALTTFAVNILSICTWGRGGGEWIQMQLPKREERTK